MRTIDVGDKFETRRSAKAYGRIRLKPPTVKLIRENKLPKGNLPEATKLTGIFGAKRTGDILPFCHPIPFDFVGVEVRLGEDRLEVFSEVRGTARTGYEMEALTAVTTALLNVYDMCKGVDDEMVIEEVRLLEKSGGKSDWKVSLEDVSASVISEFPELKSLVEGFLSEMGAKLSGEPSLLVRIGDGCGIDEHLFGLESVIALYDFSKDPLGVTLEVKIGRDREGRLVICLPADEGKVRRFFETFGPLLGGIVR